MEENYDKECIVLASNDGNAFRMSYKAAKLSKTILTSVHKKSDISDPIPLPLTSLVLDKVIKFCEFHVHMPMTEIKSPLLSMRLEDIVQQYYVCYVKDTKEEMVLDLVSAANYLEIRPLFDLTCLAVALFIKNKPHEEIRRIFGFDNNQDEYDDNDGGGKPKARHSI